MSARAGGTLSVFLDLEPLGKIERRGPTRYRFTFSGQAVDKYESGEIVLSASLPLREAVFTPSESAPFFEGLLPEGPVRTAISRALRLNEQDGFGLLESLGADCAGAVSVLPDGIEPRPTGEGRVRSLSEDELDGLIEDLPRNPLGVSAGAEGVRLSLGGVQHKLVLARDSNGELGQPLDRTPSTLLLKPDFGQYEDLVANEAFCMKVASEAGLEVAEARIVPVKSRSCLLVERFDRTADDRGRVVRLHQEDMCQALGILPTAKYEEADGPSAARIVELIRRLAHSRATVDIRDFVRAMAANFILGNSDAHGKNFALLYDPQVGIRLAPLYDLVSTAVYPELTSQMAMSIGGIDDPAQIDIDAWHRFADEAGLGAVIGAVVQRQAQAVLRAAERVVRTAEAEGWHRPVIDRIVDVCRERAERLIEAR